MLKETDLGVPSASLSLVILGLPSQYMLIDNHQDGYTLVSGLSGINLLFSPSFVKLSTPCSFKYSHHELNYFLYHYDPSPRKPIITSLRSIFLNTGKYFIFFHTDSVLFPGHSTYETLCGYDSEHKTCASSIQTEPCLGEAKVEAKLHPFPGS